MPSLGSNALSDSAIFRAAQSRGVCITLTTVSAALLYRVR